MNKYAPHVYVIPEDDHDRQIADGFVLHHQVQDRCIMVMPPAGGWSHVLDTFRSEYVPKLSRYEEAHVVLLIDFDGDVEGRRAAFDQAIPNELKDRVFVVGPRDDPETLKMAVKLGFEEIGTSLADDCDSDTTDHWDHEQLMHNAAERRRLTETVKPFLF